MLTTLSYVPAYVLAAPLEGVTTGLARLNIPTFGDVDTDGDLDLLVGNFGGGLTYFQNNGSETVPVFKQQMGASDPFAGIVAELEPYGLPDPSFADWDADGDLDLALGQTSTIVAFENTGSATVPNFELLTGADNPFQDVLIYSYFSVSIAFGDMDGDDDLDAALSGGFGQNLKYLQNQDGVFVPVSGIDSPFAQTFVGGFSSPELSDLDGDGDVDLVAVSDFGRAIQFFENTGDATTASFGFSPAQGTIIGRQDSAVLLSAPAFGDLDHDGDQDLLVATFNYTNPDFQYFQAVGDSHNAPVNNYIIMAPRMTEDGALIYSTVNFNAISIADSNANDSPLEVTLGATHGTLTLATTAGLTFSLGDGVADIGLTFRGTLSDINAAMDGLKFLPDRNFTGTAHIAITTNDLGQPDGGVALSDSDRLTIYVLDVASTISDLRYWIIALSYTGDFTVGQRDALLSMLELTGDVGKDVRQLKTYLKMVTGIMNKKSFPPGFESIFIGLAEKSLNALLTT